MRIGFDAKRATHNFRGLGNYSRGLIEGLLTYAQEDELFLYSPPIKDKRGDDWINSLNSKAHLKVPDNFFSQTLSPLWRSFALAKVLEYDKLDIFHGLSHEIPFGMKGKKSFKKVVTIHDLIYLRYPEFFPAIDRVVYNQKFRYACKHADMVIAICQQTKDDLIRFFGIDEKKVAIHYQSCSPHFYEQRPVAEIEALRKRFNLSRPFILNVGAFEPRKNQLSLLKAYAQISSRVNADLVFVGGGKKYKSEVEEQIGRLNLQSRVHLINISFEELPVLYQAATLFCFPSFFEGFGIPIIEALFSRVPVVTSVGSCFPESAGPHSVFIDPHSLESLKEGLLSVLEDPNLQNQMKNEGYKFVQRFHRRNSTIHLKELYSQVME